MPRMIDELLAHGVDAPWWVRDPEEQAKFRAQYDWLKEVITDCPRIVVDNIADYLYHGTDQEQWDLARDFPNVAPPYQRFWMEYQQPRLIISRETGRTEAEGPLPYYGLLFHTRRLEEMTEQILHPDAEGQQEHDEQIQRRAELNWRAYGEQVMARVREYPNPGDAWPHLTDFERGILFQGISLNRGTSWARDFLRTSKEHLPTGWVMHVYCYAYMEHRHCVGPVADWTLLVGERGEIVHHQLSIPGDADTPPEFVREHGENISAVIFTPLLALCFMHCKNVEMQRCEPPEALSRARERRHGAPLQVYHVLVVEAVQRLLRTVPPGATAVQQRLHIQRGHFKTFGEKPLFGKIRGTYFWMDSVRGHPELGVVDKDYDIHPPEVPRLRRDRQGGGRDGA